jgi:hypothetical protein
MRLWGQLRRSGVWHDGIRMLMYLLVLSLGAVQPQPQQADALVRQLSAQIVARRPLGIPDGEDKAAIWPLLSGRLVRQLETARACQVDYLRRHGTDDGKPDFGWLESGLFSGDNERAIPAEIAVERVERLKSGAFRVVVRFTYRESFETYGRPPDPANFFSWRGAMMVVPEAGQLFIDDVVLFRDGSTRVESRLSEAFVGCAGPRWVGYGKRR